MKRFITLLLITVITQQVYSSEIEELILQLNSENYQEREQAEYQLSKLGQAAKPQLEIAIQSEDTETRIRATKLIKILKIQDLWKSTLITCDHENILVSDAIQLLNELSGNTISCQENYNNKSVNLKYTQTPYWKIIDELCEQTDNQIKQNHDFRNPGVVLTQRESRLGPVVYHGPVRARIKSAKRIFIEEFDYEQDKSEITHTFQITLQLVWEDKFRIVAHKSHPDIVEAVTNDGTKLSGTGLSDSWTLVQRGPYQATMTVNIQPPSVTATHFKSLKFRWGALAVGDMAEFEIPVDITDTPHAHEDLEIRIDEISEKLPDRQEITILLNRDIILPHPTESVFFENDFKFLDENNIPVNIVSQSNTLNDEGVKIRLVLATRAAKKLVLRYPRIRSRKDVEIEFTDVPLPVSIP